VKIEICRKLRRKRQKRNVSTIGFWAHTIFWTFIIGRLTYCLTCRYSVVIRVRFILLYFDRSVSRSDQRTRANRIIDCNMPKSWCKSVQTTKWTSFHLIYRRDLFIGEYRQRLLLTPQQLMPMMFDVSETLFVLQPDTFSHIEQWSHATRSVRLLEKATPALIPSIPWIFGHSTVPTSTQWTSRGYRSGALSSRSTTRMHTTLTNWGSVCTAWNRQRNGRVVRMS